MWYTIWYALGIFTGVYITSVRFRIRFNKSFSRFLMWLKDVVERNKRIRKQEEEIRILHGTAGSVNRVVRLK